MIVRTAEKELLNLASQFKSLALLGPRQSGKTTLAKKAFPDKPYVSFENPDIRRFAIEDPRGFLEQYSDGAILDEIQRTPEIFSYLQEILDNQQKAGSFILTGSYNFQLQESISQSLAGRIAYLFLLPFDMKEIPLSDNIPVETRLFTGSYPAIYDQKIESEKWFQNYIRTYIERDVRLIKNITNLDTFELFLRLCAGRNGQILNMQSMAIQIGVDHKTILSWISLLEQSFIAFRLIPHHKNFNKRLIKSPKLYFYDSGLVCALLGIQTPKQLITHPLYGAVFESFVVSELLKSRYNAGLESNLFFWRDNTGHEIDILVDKAGELHPIEIKSGKTISSDYFKGLEFWKKISGSKSGTVVYAGQSSQKRSTGFQVIPIHDLPLL
jgi:predicted AAA+ superfamily ATPase